MTRNRTKRHAERRTPRTRTHFFSHRFTFFFFLPFCFSLAACGGGTPEPPSPVAPTPTTVATAAARPPTIEADPAPFVATALPAPTPTALVFGGTTLPEHSNWYSTQRSDPLGYMLGTWLHASLLNPTNPTHQLASEWEVNGNQIRFELQEDVTWSDGTPIRGADIVDVLQQAVAAGELIGVGRMSANGQQVTITAQGEVCPVLMRIGAFPIVDVREFPPVRTSGAGEMVPLDEDKWEYRSADGAVRYVYRYFEDENGLRRAWEADEITGVFGASRLTLGPLPDAQRAASTASNMLGALLFRLGDGTVQPIAVRDALSLSIDRTTLYQTAYGLTLSNLPSALLPPTHWASPDTDLPYNVELANDLLEGAGWLDRNGDRIRENNAGEPLTITLLAPLSRDEQWEAVAHGIVEQWQAIGVAGRVQFVESYPLQERLHDGRWQVALVAYQLDPDPDQRALWTPPFPNDLVGQDLNVTGYNNAQVTNLLNRAVRVPDCDLTERAILYEQAWELIVRDKPVYPLFPLPLDIVVQ